MNSKKAKRAARLLRKNRAQRDAFSASMASSDAELDKLDRQMKEVLARGERITFEPMSIKDRKRLSKKPLISEEQRKNFDLAKRIEAMCQRQEIEGK